MLNTEILVVIFSFLACMVLSSWLFYNFKRNNLFEDDEIYSIFAIGISFILGSFPLVIYFWNDLDFITSTDLYRFIIPYYGVIIILSGLLINRPFSIFWSLLAASVLTIFTGNIFIEFSPDFPAFLNKLITVLYILIFSYGFKSIAGLIPFPQIELITICSGFIILYILNSFPLALTIVCGGLLGCSVASYFNGKKFPLFSKAIPLLGYLIATLSVFSYSEYLFSCFLSFSALLIAEFFIAFIRNIVLPDKYNNFIFASISFNAYDSGISPSTLIKYLWNTNIVLIILGAFQINTSNQYPLLTFSLILVSLRLYRLDNWSQENLTFKEINHQLLNDVKNTFNVLLNKPEQEDQSSPSQKSDKQP